MAGHHLERQAQEMAGIPVLNVAAVCPVTKVLGPGSRAVVWVQGCPIHCPGCIAPDWIPVQPATLIHPEELAEQILANPEVSGLTFSGGEPMMQASALAMLARKARKIRDINIICFSGFRLAQLTNHAPYLGVEELLREVDVLIDGPYLERLNDNKGLRGSSNQKVHYLTERLRGFPFEDMTRQTEIRITDGQALLVGVPTAALHLAFQQAMKPVQMGTV